MQFSLPVRIPGQSPYFVELPGYINGLVQLPSNASFTVPNNFRFLNLDRKLDVLQDLQTLLDNIYIDLDFLEWKEITINRAEGQSSIICLKLEPHMLVRVAPFVEENDFNF